MKAGSRKRFEKKAHASAVANRPHRVSVDNGEFLDCSATFRSFQIELDRGRKTTKTVQVEISKSELATEPPIGREIVIELFPLDRYEIYEVNGLDAETWIARGALFPEKV